MAVAWTVTEQTDFSEGVVVDTVISGEKCAAHKHRIAMATVESTYDNRMTSRIT